MAYTKYGDELWHLQPETVSISADDRNVFSAAASWKAMCTTAGGGDSPGEDGGGEGGTSGGISIPPFPAGAKLGQAFPYNSALRLNLYCNKIQVQLYVGFAVVTGYYVGLSGDSEDRSEIRTEWITNTRASPIETHPNFLEGDPPLKDFAIIEDDLFVAFPVTAPQQLGGVTDFLDPAATLRVSWVEEYSKVKNQISGWTGQVGKIAAPPEFAEFDEPESVGDGGDRNFLLNSFNFSFYAKAQGDSAKWADLSLEYLLSQEGGWNELIYKQAEPEQEQQPDGL